MLTAVALAMCWLSITSISLGCGRRDPNVLRIAAATSLRQVMVELEQNLEPEIEVEVAIAASGTLVRQIEAGVDFDLLIAAARWPIEELASQQLTTGPAHTLATNQLVVVSLDPDLRLKTWVTGSGRLAIGDPRYVPAGRYAQEWLEQQQLLGALRTRQVFTADVAGVAAHIAAGSVDAGILYRTEAVLFPRLHPVEELNLDQAPEVVAVALQNARTDLADQALQFLLSSSGREIFVRHGFDLP